MSGLPRSQCRRRIGAALALCLAAAARRLQIPFHADCRRPVPRRCHDAGEEAATEDARLCNARRVVVCGVSARRNLGLVVPDLRTGRCSRASASCTVPTGAAVPAGSNAGAGRRCATPMMRHRRSLGDPAGVAGRRSRQGRDHAESDMRLPAVPLPARTPVPICQTKARDGRASRGRLSDCGCLPGRTG